MPTQQEVVAQKIRDNRFYQLLLLTLITLLAIGLRFYKLGEWSFWGDEYITVRKAIDIFGGGITRLSPSMVSTHVVLDKLGVTEWNARLVSASVGVISIPILFWIVKRLYSSIYVALISALLLAVSPWHIYWSQNARFYTALLLFFTLALLFFYRALEEDRPWFMVLSLFFFGFASMERLLSVFLIPTIIGYIILLKIGKYSIPPGLNWRNLAIYFVPGLLGLVALILLNPSIQDPERGARSFGFVNNNPLWILSGLGFYLGIPLIVMAIFGGLSLWTKRNRLGLLLSIMALVPLFSLMFISLFQYTANRYAFVSLTSIIILAAFAAKELLARMPQHGKILAVGAVLVLLAMPMTENFLYYNYQYGNRDNWKEAFELIATRMDDEDTVITSNRALADYYLETETIGMQSVEVAGLDKVIDGNERVWVVIDVTAVGKGPTVIEWARANARYIDSFDVNISARTFPMEVYLYNPLQTE